MVVFRQYEVFLRRGSAMAGSDVDEQQERQDVPGLTVDARVCRIERERHFANRKPRLTRERVWSL